MKKIFLLLAIMLPMVLVSCSDDEDKIESGSFPIELSEEDVSISVGEAASVNIIGADPNMCTAHSEDEFVAEAMIYDGRIDIMAKHVGETTITVKAKDAEARCIISVTPLIDYVGSTVTDWGITYDELKEKVERPYDSFMDDVQRGSKNFTYTKEGYKITNRYYFENGTLCGVEKVIKGSGTDTDVFLNTTNSLNNYVDYESNYSETINSYPKAKVQGYIYSYPQKYYAVYEQTRYDMLWETGTRPATKNVIYYAKDLDTAKEHDFIGY